MAKIINSFKTKLGHVNYLQKIQILKVLGATYWSWNNQDVRGMLWRFSSHIGSQDAGIV